MDSRRTHVASGSVSADASFRFVAKTKTASGTWTVHAWIPGRARASTTFEPEGRSVVDVVVTLPTAAPPLHGILVDSSRRPVSGATFFLVAGGPVAAAERGLPVVGEPRTWDTSVVAFVRTDEHGRFHVDDALRDPWGRRSPRFGAAWPTPDYFLLVGEHRDASFVPDPDAELVVWRLPGFSIVADIRVPREAARAPVSVELVGEEPSSSRGVSGGVASPLTFVGAIPDGRRSMRWTLRVSSSKLEPFETAITLGPDEWSTRVEVELKPRSDAGLGRVVFRSPFRDSRLEPIPLVVAVERRMTTGTTFEYLQLNEREDETSEVVLAPGAARLHVHPRSLFGASVVATSEVTIREGKVVFPRLEFPPHGAIRLRLDPPAGSPERLRVRARAPSGTHDEPYDCDGTEIEVPIARAGPWVITTRIGGVERSAEVVVEEGQEATAILAPPR
jgi:hypothetical protein